MAAVGFEPTPPKRPVGATRFKTEQWEEEEEKREKRIYARGSLSFL